MTEQDCISKNNKIKESGKATREKRSSQSCFVYKVKIDYSALNIKQKEQLKMLFVEAKWLYNNILNYSNDNVLSTYDTKSKCVNVLNKNRDIEIRELKYISSHMKQSILADMISSIRSLSTLKKKGSKIGHLKYLSDYKSINLKQYGNTYKIYNCNKIRIQGISGKIKVNGLKQFINISNIDIANAKILNTPKGYYLAITIYRYNKDIVTKPYINEEIGIDMGIKDTLVLSNGEKFSIVVEETEHLKRLLRKFARQKKGSNNHYKTKLLIKKEYQKISNKKNDMANKLVAYILSYEHIYMQDEQISNWHKGLFGKQVQHSILGRIKAKLINHDRVEVLDKSVPTTKYCPVCENINKNISLSDRVYTCPICGYTRDRDIHSANNMIIMTKNIQLRMEHTEVKPVEIMKSIIVETGSSQIYCE